MVDFNTYEDDIIEKAKDFFRKEIIPNHKKNTEKLKELKEFQVNPFLDKYKANFFFGNDSPESIARSLIYPRVLGTSINTIFGSQLQKFCNETLESFASTTSGMDIEFIDKLDGRKKYCQIKAGPNTINKDDIDTIKNHFMAVKNLARTNNLNIGLSDLIVGVFYGEPSELSNHYQKIDMDFPVYVGKEFWHRLTGDEDFYIKLTDAIGEVAKEVNSKELVEEVVKSVAEEIRKQEYME
ncbi:MULTISPECIES: PmeII family type II restriction endonuclease [Listeria]|uniref:PmeII family type II restriction endonuclease n=1 Tax=Listeria TaxID=1637 RepID=UPI001627A6D4|nr:PmeII family type II restriction endonuclease [Listeria booriae]MBC1504507.1 restriction endonuclease [Listeria booriae]